MPTTIRFVYVTFPDDETARRIGRAAVENGAAACVNIHTPSQSIYRWKGELHEETEVVALFKTSCDTYEKLYQFLVAEHPYDVPCILPWDSGGGHPPFLDWVYSETSG